MNASVVIPAYNAAATIGQSLDSLCAQTFSTWEAVVVDDGSSDATGEIARAFAAREPRIRLVTQTNKGEAGARNTGIAHARHDWLLFLDADDWIAPTYLARVTDAISADPGLDAVHCGSVRVALDGTEISDGYRPPTGDLFPTLANRAAFPVHACVVRKALVEAVGGFDTSFKTSTDWDLWQRVARTGARFGAIDDVLAFYRMQPSSASLQAAQLFADGLRVLHQGRSADQRVTHPHPAHAQGVPAEGLHCQQLYLLCWCAGLLIGGRQDGRSLLSTVPDARCADLYPPAVALCLFQSATLPTCQTSEAWEALWQEHGPQIESFVTALEQHAGAAGLASRTLVALKRRILGDSPTWKPVIEEVERTTSEQERLVRAQEARNQELARSLTDRESQLQAVQAEIADRDVAITALETAARGVEAERDDWRQRSTELLATTQALELQQQTLQSQLDDLRRRLDDSELRTAAVETRLQTSIAETAAIAAERTAVSADLDRVKNDFDAATAEHRSAATQLDVSRRLAETRQGRVDALEGQAWVRLGERAMRFRDTPGWARFAFACQRARLKLDGTIGRLFRPGRQRVLATACWQFPIYSQTFVYQELSQLARSGRTIRFLYGQWNHRDPLPDQFDAVRKGRRRFFVHHDVCQDSYDHYARVIPDRVEALVRTISDASGLSAEDVRGQYHFRQAFAFTRLVEAYRPSYIHSYFFYEGTFFTFVAAHLLALPRGVSCYADHVLDDYALKMVPLHLRQCAIVIATSERIKRELLEIAPGTDASRILVKPNGINAAAFPPVARQAPGPNEPFRLVSVCRIEPKKGLVYLVEAIARLRDRGLGVVLHILGGVDDSESSRQYHREVGEQIRALGLEDRVFLEGRKSESEINEFFRRAHVYVAPFVETSSGDKDGIPTSLLEGMASGLPVVGTDAGSIPEVISHDRDGLVVPQKDPDALAAAIAGLMDDGERRARLGAGAAARIREAFDATTCERVFHERLTQVLTHTQKTR